MRQSKVQVKVVDDRAEYERQTQELPIDECAMAEELTRYADLCRYFEEASFQVPPHIVRELYNARSLSPTERLATLRDLNQELMEYLNNVSEDSKLRM